MIFVRAWRNVARGMRTPVRSEAEAFRIVIAAALVIGVAILIGWLTEPLIGVAALAVAIAVALIS
jgi:hypothetical protein